MVFPIIKIIQGVIAVAAITGDNNNIVPNT
jgi:hypothetical protein